MTRKTQQPKKNESNKIRQVNREMTEGVFVLLDCLGFKGIWNRIEPKAILNKLTEINDWCNGTINPKFEVLAPSCDHNLDIEIQLLSDTVAVSIKYGESTEHAKYPSLLVAYAVALVILIHQRFAFEEPCIPIRGCITYGKHLTSDRFILGPSVDSAAENEKLAEGAFIWLDPSAGQLIQEYYQLAEAIYEGFDVNEILEDKRLSTKEKKRKIGVIKTGAEPFTLEFPVPLKGGSVLSCEVVNPFLYFTKERQNVYLKRIFMSMNSPRIEVVVKQQNTFSFLEEAISVTNTYWDTVKKRGKI